MKVLIGTETSHKKGAPHIVATIINCKNIQTREDKYKDVIGFYKILSDGLNTKTHNEMCIWVNSLNKNLIVIIKQKNKIVGWLYYIENDEIKQREVEVLTSNDITYDVWIDPDSNFWNPVDFLLEGEYFIDQSEDDILDKIDEKIDKLSSRIESISVSVLQLTNALKTLVQELER